MKHTLAAFLVGIFAMMTIATEVAADSDTKKVAKACKDKKAGTEVTVRGKKFKCPGKK